MVVHVRVRSYRRRAPTAGSARSTDGLPADRSSALPKLFQLTVSLGEAPTTSARGALSWRLAVTAGPSVWAQLPRLNRVAYCPWTKFATAPNVPTTTDPIPIPFWVPPSTANVLIPPVPARNDAAAENAPQAVYRDSACKHAFFAGSSDTIRAPNSPGGVSTLADGISGRYGGRRVLTQPVRHSAAASVAGIDERSMRLRRRKPVAGDTYSTSYRAEWTPVLTGLHPLDNPAGVLTKAPPTCDALGTVSRDEPLLSHCPPKHH